MLISPIITLTLACKHVNYSTQAGCNCLLYVQLTMKKFQYIHPLLIIISFQCIVNGIGMTKQEEVKEALNTK